MATAKPKLSTPKFYDQAATHYRQGQYPAASQVLGAALRLQPKDATLWNLAGATSKALGQAGEAERCWRVAIALAPDYADAWFNLGLMLQQNQRLADAIAAYRQVLRYAPQHVQALNNLGSAYASEGQLEEALQCYEQAVAKDPLHAKSHHNRGNALGALGRFEEAHQAFEAALALTPKERAATIYRSAAYLKKFSPNDPILRSMEDLAGTMAALSPGDQMQLNFALGKAYGDIGERDRSFAHLQAGNLEKRRQVPYDEAATLAEIDQIRRLFSPEWMASRSNAGHVSEAPVFVIGMMRSGSTLVEQILASHPQIHGAGECEEFRLLAEALQFPKAIDSLSQEGLRQLGKTYTEGLQARAPQALRIVDKNLKNFLRAGLIHLALPSAKIIHTQRDPVDTCLSCYSYLFSGNHPYAYDLAELGRYWRAYDELMAHWRSVLPPGVMLEVRYEDLVDDLEGQSRRLIEHCGLEWNEACLNFNQTKRPVRTASVTQVREPLYRSSVQKSRAYGELLKPLLDALTAG